MSARTTTDWDAHRYHRCAAPQEEWARAVLGRLPLDGDETALDAGCGSGRVTRLLLERLPRGRVIGVDGSPSMIEAAREAFAGDARITLINSDLLALDSSLLREQAGVGAVDAIFSNATFHWIEDHAALFRRLFALLRSGGRLTAQCGGRGNVAGYVEAIHTASGDDPFREYVAGFEPWNFYGPEETERRLADAGFVDVRCWLQELEPFVPESPREFVGAVGLAPHHERLPEDLRERFTAAVAGALPEGGKMGYVRLNIDAVRPR